MDASEENQLRIYDLTEEKKKLKLQIDEEQYMNLSLHRRRSMFSASIIKNIVIFLYFLFLYLGMKFLANIMDIGEAVKDNPVVKKLLELSDPALGLIEGALLLVLVVTVIFFVRKLYLIWLNSDDPAAIELAEKTQRQTYNRQIAGSNQKLAALLFHLQEVEEELYVRSEKEKDINGDYNEYKQY